MANPRADHITQPRLLKFGDDAAQATLPAVVAQHASDSLYQLRVAGNHAEQGANAAQTAHAAAATCLCLLPTSHRAQN